jgi:hypothetical protein
MNLEVISQLIILALIPTSDPLVIALLVVCKTFQLQLSYSNYCFFLFQKLMV